MADKDEKSAHTRKQRWVKKQIALATILNVIQFFIGTHGNLIDTSNLDTITDRLALTIRCLFFSSFSILYGIHRVGKIRFTTSAINPVTGGGENLVDIPNRILRNTVEQFLLHVVGMLTLTTVLDSEYMGVIPVLTVIFLSGRVMFWIGYTSSPMNRGVGFASTFLPTVATYVFCTFSIARTMIL